MKRSDLLAALPPGHPLRASVATKSAARSAGAAKAKRNGDRFERLLLAPNEHVKLIKLPASGARFIGRGKSIPEEMPFDFLGCTRTGRAVFFDAKSVGADHASISAKQIKPHQIAALQAMEAQGAIAGILVECNYLSQYLWMSSNLLGTTISFRNMLWIGAGHLGEPVDWAKIISHDG